VVVGVALLIFGPSKAPELGKSVGQALKSFKKASVEFEKELKSEAADEEKPAEPTEKIVAEKSASEKSSASS